MGKIESHSNRAVTHISIGVEKGAYHFI